MLEFFFGRGAHFRASLPLLVSVKNVYLMNPSLDPSGAGGGGVHTSDNPPGYF